MSLQDTIEATSLILEEIVLANPQMRRRRLATLNHIADIKLMTNTKTNLTNYSKNHNSWPW